MATKANDDSSLSHTRWNCKYHIVFIPKYRRKEIYGKLRSDIGLILRQLCEYKNVEIVEAHAMKDHIHMLVKIPPKLAVSSFMGYLKGKSSLMIFEKHANLKYKYGNRNFWAKGYYVSTVGLVLAYGSDFPDGLCGGPLAYQVGAPLILTRNDKTDIARPYTKARNIVDGYALGGTSVLPDATVRKLFGASDNVKINEIKK